MLYFSLNKGKKDIYISPALWSSLNEKFIKEYNLSESVLFKMAFVSRDKNIKKLQKLRLQFIEKYFMSFSNEEYEEIGNYYYYDESAVDAITNFLLAFCSSTGLYYIRSAKGISFEEQLGLHDDSKYSKIDYRFPFGQHIELVQKNRNFLFRKKLETTYIIDIDTVEKILGNLNNFIVGLKNGTTFSFGKIPRKYGGFDVFVSVEG